MMKMLTRKTIVSFALLLAVLGLVCAVSGCSRDPNVRKQKYLESAQRYFEKGQNREAMIQYMNAIQVDPQFAEAHYGLAQVNLKMGAWNSAVGELKRTIELQPENLKAQLDLGNLEVAAREFQAAMGRADMILAKDPAYVGAHVLKANVHAALGEKEASLDAMQRAILLAPNNSELWVNFGLLQVNAGKPAQAEASFRKAIELKPDSSAPTLALAGLYQVQNRLAEAEQQYERAVQLEPKQLAPRLALARFYMMQQRRDRAEQVVRDASLLKDAPEARTMLVDFYSGLGEKDKALAAAAELYQGNNKDLLVKQVYVRTLLANNRVDEATRVNEEILKVEPNNANALIAKGQIYNHTGKPGEAIRLLETALKLEPDNALGHYVLGVSANLTDDVTRAEKEWLEAARLRPGLVEAQQSLATLALRKGDLDLLARSSEELVKAQPTSPNGYVLRALAAASRKEPAKVEDDLQKAIAVAPQNAVGYAKLGVWRLGQKKYAAAEKLFEQALELDANAAEALQGLANLYADVQKNTAKAMSRVKTQIDRAPNNSTYYVIQGVLQSRSEGIESAQASLQKAIELDHGNVDAFMLLAQLQTTAGRTEQAIATYERLIKENPKDVRALVLLGVLEQSRANWQRAQSLYERALQISPDHPAAANNLAYLLLEHGGNLDVALSLAQAARRRMPDSTNAADTLAWAYYQKGIYPLAAGLLEECVRKAPQNPTYHYHLGLVLQKQNENSKARKHLEQVLKIDPKYPEAQRVHKALSELGVQSPA